MQPIEWHQTTLSNMRVTFAGKKRQLNGLLDDCRRLELEIMTYEAQIAQARTQGHKAFERGRMGKTARIAGLVKQSLTGERSVADVVADIDAIAAERAASPCAAK